MWLVTYQFVNFSKICDISNITNNKKCTTIWKNSYFFIKFWAFFNEMGAFFVKSRYLFVMDAFYCEKVNFHKLFYFLFFWRIISILLTIFVFWKIISILTHTQEKRGKVLDKLVIIILSKQVILICTNAKRELCSSLGALGFFVSIAFYLIVPHYPGPQTSSITKSI